LKSHWEIFLKNKLRVSIIKYNAGNVQSVIFALNRLGIEPILTDDIETLKASDKVIFPGVGEASSCMNSLKATGLDKLIPELKQPVLGICVGLQLMCKHSEESDTKALGIFDVNVKKFSIHNSQLSIQKVPQMGWNTIFDLKTPLFKGIHENSFIYYVHSYAAELGKDTVATTDYTTKYSAALQKDNFYAVQFHTEKSSIVGSQILDNFLKYC
jgi:glutamine amidotransferase